MTAVDLDLVPFDDLLEEIQKRCPQLAMVWRSHKDESLDIGHDFAIKGDGPTVLWMMERLRLNLMHEKHWHDPEDEKTDDEVYGEDEG